MSWLWKGDANSPASFEKALSKLATQVTAASLAVDTSRSRSRRIKALWTLYTILTYLVYVLIIVLVLGPQNWTLPHYAGLTGAPLIIYGVRKVVALFYDWRIARQQAYLQDLQKQRESKINDLKKATKYDSTQELLQKYGGGPPKYTPMKESPSSKRRANTVSHQTPVQRTGLPPPPTANIPGRNITPQSTPQRPIGGSPRSVNQSPMISSLTHSPVDTSPDVPEFAPNAFDTIHPSARPTYHSPPHWYDRILDVLIGDDEAAAKNRIALICNNCRLVNGQAPPGVMTLQELGKWKCSSCGSWNGVESEGAKVVKAVTGQSSLDHAEGWNKVPNAGDMNNTTITPTREDSVPVSDAGKRRTTGRDSDDDGEVTRRVTRSAHKDEPLDSLE